MGIKIGLKHIQIKIKSKAEYASEKSDIQPDEFI